jgi:hypothetical protein
MGSLDSGLNTTAAKTSEPDSTSLCQERSNHPFLQQDVFPVIEEQSAYHHPTSILLPLGTRWIYDGLIPWTIQSLHHIQDKVDHGARVRFYLSISLHFSSSLQNTSIYVEPFTGWTIRVNVLTTHLTLFSSYLRRFEMPFTEWLFPV